MIGFVKLRILEPDDQCVLRGDRLKEAMMEDIENGLYPFFVSTTLGTTGCCAFDRLDEIGPVCKVRLENEQSSFVLSWFFSGIVLLEL